MDDALRAELEALGADVRTATIPSDHQHTTAWCLGQLPALYAKFRQTRETRYGDEITRLVQAVLKALVDSKAVCPEAPKLAAGITERLRRLHEQLGLPGLGLKTPGAATSRSRATPRSRKAG
jgi:hypothetical protein